jgi:hypothetical protein
MGADGSDPVEHTERILRKFVKKDGDPKKAG